MDKDLFIKVLQNYTGSSLDEAQEIISLAAQYPYSQLLHTLSARVSKDHNLKNEQRELQLAAVYAADRAVLKDIITYNPTADSEELDVKTVTAEAITVEEDTKTHTIYQTIDSVDVVSEIALDMKRLNELKNNFEMLFMDNQKPKVRIHGEVKQISDESSNDTEEVIETSKEESPRSKKERIVGLAKAMIQPDAAEEKPILKHSLIKRPKKERKVNPADELIEEIKVTKEEIVPENEKQKEQIDLIDQFIKIQPSITGAKERSMIMVSDLNPIKSGEFTDNIVSETLVEILIKQGKRDKAIEVLKKLIWKYPQKKSYFAGLIESLRS